MSFRAKYDDVCGNDCGDRIHQGDQVGYLQGVLVHVFCQPSDKDNPAPRPICPTCYMETALNGACSC